LPHLRKLKDHLAIANTSTAALCNKIALPISHGWHFRIVGWQNRKLSRPGANCTGVTLQSYAIREQVICFIFFGFKRF
jgi:hypothetical protein